jgi:hypothetical protein
MESMEQFTWNSVLNLLSKIYQGQDSNTRLRDVSRAYPRAFLHLYYATVIKEYNNHCKYRCHLTTHTSTVGVCRRSIWHHQQTSSHHHPRHLLPSRHHSQQPPQLMPTFDRPQTHHRTDKRQRGDTTSWQMVTTTWHDDVPRRPDGDNANRRHRLEVSVIPPLPSSSLVHMRSRGPRRGWRRCNYQTHERRPDDNDDRRGWPETTVTAQVSTATPSLPAIL